MATKKIKYTEKELKQPDEFNKTISRIIDFTSDHAKKILIAVGAIIVVLIAAFFINSSSESKKLEANTMFDGAIAKYEAESNEEALAEFLQVRDQYPSEGISNIAIYYAALINFNNEEYAQAIELLNSFEAQETDEEMLIDSAVLIQGLAYFNQSDWQKAIDYLSRITSPESPYENQAKLHMAISYEKLGDTDRANMIYYKLLENEPGANLGASSTVIQNPPSN